MLMDAVRLVVDEQVSQPVHIHGRALGRGRGRKGPVPRGASGAAVNPHLPWLREWPAAYDVEFDESDDCPHRARFKRLENLILGTSPATTEGVAARLYLIAAILHGGLAYEQEVTGPLLAHAARHLNVPPMEAPAAA